MPFFVKSGSSSCLLETGALKCDVRGKYISNTFRRRTDADTWALETERTTDKDFDPDAAAPAQSRLLVS